MQVHILLNLGVLLEQRKSPLHAVLLRSVHFLLELLTVAHRMVHIVVQRAGRALILPQVPLIVADFEHDLTLYGKRQN